ncbi:MAG: RHS repeat-associated core domain-containing protein [Chthoniobacterales bacterium]
MAPLTFTTTGNLVQEGVSANSVARTYVHGARVDEIVASATGGTSWLYHQYDARGHCIMLTNTSGAIQEQYEYDAFGQPYIYGADGALVARNLGSPVGNRFLFTGREWIKELRVYDYRNRLYQPELGRFVQPDPKQFEAGDYNLYRYCHNDPVNKSDPTGLYGMGTGWTDEQWKKFDTAQQAAAARIEKAAAKMDVKTFEKVFGKGSATPENMAKVQETMGKMVAALRDDGTNGYKANAYTEKGRVMGRGDVGGKELKINVGHSSFGNHSALTWVAGHESGHNAGMGHGTVNGVTAYKYGNEAEKDAYKNLPTAGRLGNPDNYMDFSR